MESERMKTRTHVSKILWCEGIGFLAIIALSWLNELSDLPHVVSGVQYISNWRESALETPIVLLTAIPVMILTKRIVSRLYYLEGFLRVCAWCKKLGHNGEWIPLEEFFESKFQTETSHGMCSACMDDMKAKRQKSLAA
jgi:hypothetical protein